MTSRLSLVLLWLFVLNLGIAFGAGLYEARIVVPDWILVDSSGVSRWNAEAARQDNTGLRFWAVVSTVPLTLLTVANLIAGWRARGTLRRWWLAAAAAALVERVFTFGFFIPTMIELMATPDSPGAAATALLWSNLNHVRHAIMLAAWLLSLRTLTLAHAVRARGDVA